MVFLCCTCFCFFFVWNHCVLFYLIYGCFTEMHFGLWRVVFAYMRLCWGLLNMCLLKMLLESPVPCLFTVLRFMRTFTSLRATFSPSKYHKPLFPVTHLPNSQLSLPHSLNKSLSFIFHLFYFLNFVIINILSMFKWKIIKNIIIYYM